MKNKYIVLLDLLIILFTASCHAEDFDIVLNDKDSNCETTITLVKTLNTSIYPDYEFSYCQGAVSYGDYVFMCLEKGGQYATTHIAVIDAHTLEPIGLMDTGEKMHGNSLNFSDIHYNDDDEYPLLFMSNYYVMRIQNNDGEWTAQRVSKITSDINAPTFAIDNNNHILYLFNYIDNKSYNVNQSVDKHNIIRAFDMKKYDFCHDVYLQMQDALDVYELPYYIIGQDVKCKDGLIYWCNDELSYSEFCIKEGGIWVVDFGNKKIAESYSYTQQISYENESIWFHNNDLYFATKGGNNVCIYKLEKPNITTRTTQTSIDEKTNIIKTDYIKLNGTFDSDKHSGFYVVREQYDNCKISDKKILVK